MSSCIITGATGGIGKATAIFFAKENLFDNLILIGRNSIELKNIKNSLSKISNTKIKTYIIDLEKLNILSSKINKIFEENFDINCILNIAGYTDPQPLINMSLESLEKTYKINVFAPMILIRESLKYFKVNKEEKKIINIASTAGISSRPGWIAYASSKAALISASNTLSEELSEYNIKVYSLSPGRCATALRTRLAPNEDQNKIMQPSQVAEVIFKVVKDKDGILDGQNIIIRKR